MLHLDEVTLLRIFAGHVFLSGKSGLLNNPLFYLCHSIFKFMHFGCNDQHYHEEAQNAREITIVLLCQNTAHSDSSAFQQFLPRLMFMKNGGHCASLGAMLNSVEKFTIDREQT